MKVYMDRLWCTCWQASCESTFGWKLLHRDFSPGGCVIKSVDDGHEDITVIIKDNDYDQTLIINDDNWVDAYDSWLNFYENQRLAKN